MAVDLYRLCEVWARWDAKPGEESRARTMTSVVSTWCEENGWAANDLISQVQAERRESPGSAIHEAIRKVVDRGPVG